MPNNPFSDLANALGGAVYGDPRQQQLGQFYGQRTRGQGLKNQALQTGIDEHKSLMEGLAGDPEMIRALQGGENYSTAKGNFGKEQRAADSHKGVVDAFAEIYKDDPVLHNQYQVGRTGADILSESKVPYAQAAEGRLVAKDKRLTDALASLGQGTPEEKELARNIDLQLSGPDQRALKRIPLDKNESEGKVNVSKENVNKTKEEIKSIKKKQKNSNLTAKQSRKLAKKKALLENNLLRAKTQGEEAKSSSASKKNLLEIEKLEAEISFKKQQTQTQESLEDLRDSKEKVYALKNKIAKTRFGKRGLKAKEFVAAVDKTIALLTKKDTSYSEGIEVMHDGELKFASGLSLDQLTEVAEDHVLGVTSLDIPEDQGQDVSAALGGGVPQAPQAPEPDLAGALGGVPQGGVPQGGVPQGGVPQSVIARLSGIKGAELEALFQETRSLDPADPLKGFIEQLYLGQ